MAWDARKLPHRNTPSTSSRAAAFEPKLDVVGFIAAVIFAIWKNHCERAMRSTAEVDFGCESRLQNRAATISERVLPCLCAKCWILARTSGGTNTCRRTLPFGFRPAPRRDPPQLGWTA